MMNRLARRKPSSATGGVSGRLITDRQTRETKKVTNAAAVNGTPSCQPNAITPAAPIANSVSQKDLTRQSSVGSLSRRSLPAGGRARRRALQIPADEFLEAIEHIQISRVQ